jgi:2-C-methyl-D-erythritol 4-phosphate cytidylyltransferase
MTSVVIVAAGSSRRMGFDKLFALLAGTPVLLHSIEAFEKCPEIDEIVIVTQKDKISSLGALIQKSGFKKVTKLVAGGEERHLSVWNGLQVVNEKADFIAIHDGARPLTTPKLIRDCLKLAIQHGSACCATQVPDTVKRADEKREVTASVDRSGLWAMQTPQIFSKALITQAYNVIISTREFVTDEVSAVQRLGKKVALLENHDWNFKITLPRDLELAEQVMKLRRKAGAPATRAKRANPKAAPVRSKKAK